MSKIPGSSPVRLVSFLCLLSACDRMELETPESAGDTEEVDVGPQSASGDPGAAGPRRVVRFDLDIPLASGGTLRTTVSGPTDDGKTLSQTGAPFPFVVFSPGFSISRSQYNGYGARLASHGILTVSQSARSESNHGQYRDDTRKLIDWLLAPTGPSAERVQGRFSKERIGVAGHSLGGKISFLAAGSDPRIKAVFAIDPVDGGANPQAKDVIGRITLPSSVKLGMLGETLSKSGGFMPCTPSAHNYEVLYSRASAPAFVIQFLRSAHGDFVDDYGSCFSCRFCPGGTLAKTRTRDLAIKYTTAYFLASLAGQASAEGYLSGTAFAADAATGDVTRQAK